MADSYGNALQRMQTLNQFMNQVTPQLQQLGVDRSGYKGYAQAYQSAVNNNLAIPQDFADVMYQYGGYGNTGKQLFEPSKNGNPKLTQEGIAYASRNLPEGVALHQGFFDFGKQVSDLAKSKGDNTRYKTLQQQINAAAGYGMEIPQHIQDLAYAGGFGGTPTPAAATSTPISDAATPTTTAIPAASDDYFDAEKFKKVQATLGSDVSKIDIDKAVDYFKKEGNNVPSLEDFQNYMGSSGSQYNIRNFGEQLNRLEGLESAVKDIRDIEQSENKYDIGNFDKLLNILEEQKNNTSSGAEQKETAPQGSSNAPEFLSNFKKQLEEKAASEAASDTPTGTYAEVTGDTSTRGGRDKPNSASGPKPRENVFDRLVNNLEEARNNRGSSSLQQTIENVTERPISREELREARSRFARDSRRSSGRRGSRSGRASSNREAQGRAADRAARLGRAVYESRRSSSRRGTDFGPGRARRDSSSSPYSDSRRDRSFERRGRPFRDRFGR